MFVTDFGIKLRKYIAEVYCTIKKIEKSTCFLGGQYAEYPFSPNKRTQSQEHWNESKT